MSLDAEEVYALLVNNFIATKERYVEVQVPRRLCEQRHEIANELEYNGLITDINIYGQMYLSCTLTDDNLCVVSLSD